MSVRTFRFIEKTEETVTDRLNTLWEFLGCFKDGLKVPIMRSVNIVHKSSTDEFVVFLTIQIPANMEGNPEELLNQIDNFIIRSTWDT